MQQKSSYPHESIKKNDISIVKLADEYNNPYSFYDGTYELSRSNIRKTMIYANLSYHTFWNIVVIGRFHVCLHKCPQAYFRVNRFDGFGLPTFSLARVSMFLSLAFIWGVSIVFADYIMPNDFL